jgi:hypothetical protein
MLFLFSFVLALSAQVSPSWEWARKAGGNGSDKAYSLDIDTLGNILMIGYFNGSVFDLNGVSLSSTTSQYDYYLAKFDSAGNLIWARQGIGNGEDMGFDVVTDKDNNVITTGSFGNFSGNGISIDTVLLSNSGMGDLFLAKYNANGDLLWALKEGDAAREWGRSVDVDYLGNIYLCGNFKDGSTNLGGTVISNAGGYGYFVCKYDPFGNMLWYKTGNTPAFELVRNIVVTPETGNVYVFGDYNGISISMDSVQLFNADEGARDNYLYKLDTYGNVLWGRSIGGIAEERGNYCTIDFRENVYVTGMYRSAECFIGSDTVFNNNVFQGDTYLAMFNYNGVYEWSQSINGDGEEIAYSITTDTSDFIFLAGYFSSTVMNIGNQNVSSNGSYDLFVAKFDYQGGFHWADGVGGTGLDWAYVITMNANRELFVAGEYHSPSIQFDTSTLSLTAISDVFLAKLNDYCEMSDVYLGNDTLIYTGEQLWIDAGAGYEIYSWGNVSNVSSLLIDGSAHPTGYLPITITVVDSSGCVSSDELLLTICNYPLNFLGSDTFIFLNHQIELNADIGFTDFQWSTGDVSSSLIVDANLLGAGNHVFWVEAGDQYGCVVSDTIVIDVYLNVEEDGREIIQINVWPIPANDVLHLSFVNVFKVAEIQVINLDQKVLLNLTTPESNFIIRTDHLSNGFYLVKVTINEKTTIAGFLIQR